MVFPHTQGTSSWEQESAPGQTTELPFHSSPCCAGELGGKKAELSTCCSVLEEECMYIYIYIYMYIYMYIGLCGGVLEGMYLYILVQT
jgi:hypothetical protein